MQSRHNEPVTLFQYVKSWWLFESVPRKDGEPAAGVWDGDVSEFIQLGRTADHSRGARDRPYSLTLHESVFRGGQSGAPVKHNHSWTGGSGWVILLHCNWCTVKEDMANQAVLCLMNFTFSSFLYNYIMHVACICSHVSCKWPKKVIQMVVNLNAWL